MALLGRNGGDLTIPSHFNRKALLDDDLLGMAWEMMENEGIWAKMEKILENGKKLIFFRCPASTHGPRAAPSRANGKTANGMGWAWSCAVVGCTRGNGPRAIREDMGGGRR